MDQSVNPLECLHYAVFKPEVITEMLRQAELRQDAIFNASLGMDQRAAVIGTGMIAAAGALAAGGFAVSGTDTAPLRWAALTIAATLMAGAACCIWACRPQKSRFPGIEPLDWADQEYLENHLTALQMSRLEKLQHEIKQNERNQAINGRAITLGLSIAWLSPALGLIGFHWTAISSWVLALV